MEYVPANKKKRESMSVRTNLLKENNIFHEEKDLSYLKRVNRRKHLLHY